MRLFLPFPTSSWPVAALGLGGSVALGTVLGATESCNSYRPKVISLKESDSRNLRLARALNALQSQRTAQSAKAFLSAYNEFLGARARDRRWTACHLQKKIPLLRQISLASAIKAMDGIEELHGKLEFAFQTPGLHALWRHNSLHFGKVDSPKPLEEMEEAQFQEIKTWMQNPSICEEERFFDWKQFLKSIPLGALFGVATVSAVFGISRMRENTLLYALGGVVAAGVTALSVPTLMDLYNHRWIHKGDLKLATAIRNCNESQNFETAKGLLTEYFRFKTENRKHLYRHALYQLDGETSIQKTIPEATLNKVLQLEQVAYSASLTLAESQQADSKALLGSLLTDDTTDFSLRSIWFSNKYRKQIHFRSLGNQLPASRDYVASWLEKPALVS